MCRFIFIKRYYMAPILVTTCVKVVRTWADHIWNAKKKKSLNRSIVLLGEQVKKKRVTLMLKLWVPFT